MKKRIILICGIMGISAITHAMEYITPLIYKNTAKESPIQGTIQTISPDKTMIFIKEKNISTLYTNGKKGSFWENVKKAQFSPNSNIISIYTGNTITVYSADGVTSKGSFSLKNINKNLILFSPDSARIIAGQNNLVAQSTIISYDIQSKKTTKVSSDLPIMLLVFNGDGSKLLAQTEESITVYTSSSMIKLLTIPMDFKQVSNIELMNTQLVIALKDNIIQSYNFSSAAPFLQSLNPGQRALLTKIGNEIQKTKSERKEEYQVVVMYRYLTGNYFYAKIKLSSEEQSTFETLPEWLQNELRKYIKEYKV